MATRTDADRVHRLDPVRWPFGRRGLMSRLAAVAALLLAALALVHPGESSGICSDSRPPGPHAPTAPAGVVASPGAVSPSDDVSPAPAGRPRLPGGTVGVAVTPADPAVLGLLRAGDRVDLLAVRPGDAPTAVAEGALVLAAPAPADAGGALYLALPPDRAREIVGLPGTVRFAVLVRP